MIDKAVNKSSPVSSSPTSVASEAADKLSNIGGDVAGKAKDVGSQATATAHDLKDTIGATGADLMDRAKGMAADAGDKVTKVLEDQKAAGADRAKGISDAIRRAADELEKEFPPAATYVRRAADEIDNVADAVRRRDVRQLLGDVQNFARRQPTAFLGATVIGGFALVRLLKTSTAAGTSVASAPAPQRNRPSAQLSRMPESSRSSGSYGSGDPGGIAQEAPTFGFEERSGSRNS